MRLIGPRKSGRGLGRHAKLGSVETNGSIVSVWLGVAGSSPMGEVCRLIMTAREWAELVAAYELAAGNRQGDDTP